MVVASSSACINVVYIMSLARLALRSRGPQDSRLVVAQFVIIVAMLMMSLALSLSLTLTIIVLIHAYHLHGAQRVARLASIMIM